MIGHGKTNHKQRNSGNPERGGSSGSSLPGGFPPGITKPGFLIIQKNGVVRMNKNYKGENLGPGSILGKMF